LLHRCYEGLNVVVVIVKVKAGSDIVIAVGRNNIVLHQLRLQAGGIARWHGNGGAPP
jgi:hypothetical protein